MTEKAKSKKILFLSGVDFKEKSIQVIRKTPEAYRARGWEVTYLVGRDNATNGDYFYEAEINPPGIDVHRFYIPFARMHGLFNNAIWKAIWFRLRNLIFVFTLFYKGVGLLRKQKFSVLYGYEIPGVLALRLLRRFGFVGSQVVVVSRFQGVLFVKEWLRKGEKFRYITNANAIKALRSEADLCIMTNDGSQGATILKTLKSKAKRVLFLPNGVDPAQLDQRTLEQIKHAHYGDGDTVYLLSVSRLDHHKRIDRGLRIVGALVNGCGVRRLRYHIIGDGSEMDRLKKLSAALGIQDYVRFFGARKHDEVKYHVALSHVFISMYTSTNVGNPLLEAIRQHKLIVTLNNGDTGEWIRHKKNGLIYPVDDDLDLQQEDYNRMAADIATLISDPEMSRSMIENIRLVELEKLWTWEERLDKEVKEVEAELNRKN